MFITNLQIRKTLRLAPIALLTLIIADLVLLFVPDFLGGLALNGYLSIAITAAIVIFYAYFGFPMFSLDVKSDRLNIKSHLALSTVFGKTLSVPKMNITNLKIDRSGLRKKLMVSYINREGQEVSDKYSITILSNRKLAMLEQAVRSFEQEKSPANLHFFI
jgi:hypothetical protein